MNEERNCVILADGTKLSNTGCGYSERNLWCWIRDGKGIQECFMLFTDPEKTKNILFRYPGKKSIRYKGFTEFLLIRKVEDGVDVRLTWPDGGTHSIEESEDEK